MSESIVAQAERVARWRALLYFLMAGLLILFEVGGLRDVEQRERLTPWLLTAGLMALNLTPFNSWLRARRINEILNDESTREHRRNAFAAGFWAALAAAAGVSVATTFAPLAGIVAARMIITAALAAALISFGAQELRAAR